MYIITSKYLFNNEVFSTIFRTFENTTQNADNLFNRTGLFNKTFENTGRDIKAQGVLTGLFSGQNVTNTDIKNIKAMDAAMKNGATTAQAWQDNMTGCTVAAKQQAKQCLMSKGSLVDLASSMKSTTIAAKAAELGMKALSIAGNMVLSFLISEVVTYLFTYNQRIEESIQKSKELQEEYRNFAKESADSINSLESQETEFRRLSKGVDDYGKNISLSSDEYERYKSIVSEILGATPDLISGYDEEGNAIANKNGLLERSIELLKKEQREKLKNMVSSDTTEDIADGLKKEYQKIKDDIDGEAFFNAREIGHSLSSILNGSDYNKEEDFLEILGLKKKSGESLQQYIEQNLDLVANTIEKKKDELLKLTDADADADTQGNALFSGEWLNGLINKIEENAPKYIEWRTDLDEASHSMDDQFMLYAQYAENYDDLTDAQKAFVTQYIRSTGSIVDANGKLLSDKQLIQKGKEYTDFVENLDITDKVKMDSLYSLDKTTMSAKELEKNVDDTLNYFKDKYDLSDDFVKDFKISLGFEFLSDGSSQTDTLIKNVQDKLTGTKYDDKVKELSLEDLKIASNLNVPNDTIDSWDCLIKKIREAKGELSSPVAASRLDMISDLNGLSEGFEELDKIYSSIQSDDAFDFKLLDDEKFKENFKNLGDTYADFIETVTSNPNDIKKCKDAFNELVTEWIESEGVLDNLNEENKAVATSMLKQMGVANADEIITARLNAQQFALKINMDDSINTIAAQTSKLLAENEALGVTKSALFNLISQEKIFNDTTLSTGQKIVELQRLAEAFGVTADAALSTNYVLNEVKLMKHDGATQAEIDKYVSEVYSNQIKAKFGKVKNVDYTGGTKSKNDTSKAKSNAAELFDFIEIRISRIERRISNFGKKASDTFRTWIDRDNNLDNQINENQKLISTNDTAAKKYKKKANNVKLSENWKKKVRDGSIDIKSIKDENLKKKIKSYQDYYEKYLQANDSKEQAKLDLQELYAQKFDNIQSQYDEKISLIDSTIKGYENQISILEEQGKRITSSNYNGLISEQQKKISMLKEQEKKLTAQFNSYVKSGKVKKNSSEWYREKQEIENVKLQIQEATKALEGYKNTQREINWKNFDVGIEKMQDLVDDNNFIADLFDPDKLVDENGNLSSDGIAANGLHVINYAKYLEMSKKYSAEIAKLDQDYKNDKNNTIYLERRRSLIESQQSVIKNIQSEKEALLDLAQKGYDKLLESMQKAIEKRKEALNEIKDLYDYEKSIREQSDEINVLEKQLIAFQGDDSEETRSTIQQLKESLSDAKESLKETQYDKYISEQEKMLDKLSDDTESWITERMENQEQLLLEIINSTNNSTSVISSTISALSRKMGFDISSDLNGILKGTNLVSTTDIKKNLGFAKGGIVAGAVSSAGEDGIAFLRRGEGIIPTGMMPEWNKLIGNLGSLNQLVDYASLPLSMLNHQPSNVNIGDINMTFDLPNVKNTNDFINELQHSKRFENIIYEMTFGNNSLGKYKY